MTGVQTGPDGRRRCPWALSAPVYADYHDHEWGRPVGDDRAILEKLCLEGFQSGLSWLTILRKREGFRKAFAGFDAEAMAAFDDRDVDRLLGDASIVRHRAKILAAIANARATVALAEQGISLAALLWRHEPAEQPAPATLGDRPPATTESKALAAELRRHGFRFVGPTTAYSAMQALGVVDDHLEGCFARDGAEAERAAFRRPALQTP